MAIPDYQSIMLPLLKLAGDRESLQLREAVGLLAQHFALTDDEIRQPVPSGRQAVFHNRVSWADLTSDRPVYWNPQRGVGFVSPSAAAVSLTRITQD